MRNYPLKDYKHKLRYVCRPSLSHEICCYSHRVSFRLHVGNHVDWSSHCRDSSFWKKRSYFFQAHARPFMFVSWYPHFLAFTFLESSYSISYGFTFNAKQYYDEGQMKSKFKHGAILKKSAINWFIFCLYHSVLSANVDFLVTVYHFKGWLDHHVELCWHSGLYELNYEPCFCIVGVLESFELQFQMQLSNCFIDKINTLSELQKNIPQIVTRDKVHVLIQNVVSEMCCKCK